MKNPIYFFNNQIKVFAKVDKLTTELLAIRPDLNTVTIKTNCKKIVERTPEWDYKRLLNYCICVAQKNKPLPWE